MITYRLQIAILQRVQALTIRADHRVLNEAHEIEFYDASDCLVAAVPSAIVIDITEL
jgi:hypothetical protein